MAILEELEQINNVMLKLFKMYHLSYMNCSCLHGVLRSVPNLICDVDLNDSYQEFVVMCSFLGNSDLCGAVVGKQCPGQPPFPPPPPFTPPPPQTPSGPYGKNY